MWFLLGGFIDRKHAPLLKFNVLRETEGELWAGAHSLNILITPINPILHGVYPNLFYIGGDKFSRASVWFLKSTQECFFGPDFAIRS